MNDEPRVLPRLLKTGFQRVFVENWPVWLGGMLLGLMSVITFTWARPWGVVGGLRLWADWLMYGLGFLEIKPFPALYSTNSLLTLGLLWGAVGAAMLAGQFAFRFPPKLEIAKGVIGGILLGMGSALAGGCNVGGFYTAISALSFSGYAMMAGLVPGAYVGLKYLYWEMERFPTPPRSAPPSSERHGINGSINWSRVQQIFGGCLLVGVFVAADIYGRQNKLALGGLLLCGAAFGFIMHRSRFCFAQCFREPFMTGDGDMARAVVYSLMISVLGFSVLKWTGLRPATMFVAPHFGLGGLIGGFIFGFGMIMAGGCGSGSVWRAAEGQVKLMVVLVFFGLANSLGGRMLYSSMTLERMLGWKIYLPSYLGYPGTVLFILGTLLMMHVLVSWNEETEKWVVSP